MLKTKTTKMLLSGLLAMTFASCAMPTTKDTQKATTSSEDSLDDVDRFISDGVKNQFKDFGAEINVTLASISQLSGTTNVDSRILAARAKTIPNAKCTVKTPPPPANKPDPKVMELESRLSSMNMSKRTAEANLARSTAKTTEKAKEALKNQINMMTTQIADLEKQLADLKAKLKAAPAPVSEFDSPACVSQREAFHKDLKMFEAELNAKATKPTPPTKPPAPPKPATEPDDENETELEDENDTNGKPLTPPAPPANGKFPATMITEIKNAKLKDAPLPNLVKQFPPAALLEAGYTQAEIDLALKGIFVPKAMLDTIKDYKGKNRPLVEFVKQFPPQALEMAGYTKADVDKAIKELSTPRAGKFPPELITRIKDFKARNRPLAEFARQFPPAALIEAGYTQAEIDATVKAQLKK
jgi:hypothetical protein